MLRWRWRDEDTAIDMVKRERLKKFFLRAPAMIVVNYDENLPKSRGALAG